MKFEPRAPKEGVNVSDQHPLEEAFTLIAGLAALLTLGVIVIVFFVDLLVLFVSPRTEAWLFQDLVVQDLLPADYDSEQAAALQALVDRLSGHWEGNPYELRAGIIDSDQANALALPGGVILVTSKLLDQAQSENELAFVVGHEIGHFSNRDHLRQLGRAAVLGLIMATVIGNDAGLLGNSVIELTARSFSRDQESEADLVGLQLLYKEYGHVSEAGRFFERGSDSGEMLDDLDSYLATHPASEDRVADIKEAAEENAWPQTGPVTPPIGKQRRDP